MDKVIPSGSAWIAMDTASRPLGLEVLGATIPPYESHGGIMPSRRILDNYALVCRLEGTAFFESAACRRCEINAFSVFVLVPGVWHRYGPTPGHAWTECWTVFRGEVADRLVEEGVLSPDRPVLKDLPRADLVRAFDRLGNCMRDNVAGHVPQPTAAALFEILSILTLHQPSVAGISSPIEKAIHYLNTHVADVVSAESLAAQVGLSYISFRKRFKEVTGRSPHQYHIDLKVQRAGQALTTSALTIGEIADQVGFDDPYYFSRLFKRKTGHSPLHFRQSSVAMGYSKSR